MHLARIKSNGIDLILQAVRDDSIRFNPQNEAIWKALVLEDNKYQEFEFEIIKDNFEALCRRWIKIVDKETQAEIPFVFNDIQKRFHVEKTAFTVVLKYRKGGISTYVLVWYLVDTLFRHNTNTVILTHHADVTDEFRHKRKYIIDRLPPFLMPRIEYDNISTLSFPDIGSKYRIGTAGQKGFGAGTDIHNLHLSEAPRYPDIEAIIGSTIGAMPKNNPNNKLVWESTADYKGPSNKDFEILFKNSQKGKTKYKALFYPWYIDRTNALPLKSGETVIPTQEELDVQDRLNIKLSPEQIKYRREAEKEGAIIRKQNNPETAEEAFVTGGSTVFDVKAIDWYKKGLEDCPSVFLKQEEIEFIYFSDKGKQKLKYIPKILNNGLRIVKLPEKNKKYVLAADTAKGNISGDYLNGLVIDPINLEEVAEINGHWDEDWFSVYLYEIGLFYNNALLVPENNERTVVNKLRHALTIGQETIFPMGYPNLYRFRRSEQEVKRGLSAVEYGWNTGGNRNLMLDDIKFAVRDQQLRINFIEFIYECIDFQVNKNGKEGARSGSHDDRVMTWAIALQVRNLRIGSLKPDTGERQQLGSNIVL